MSMILFRSGFRLMVPVLPLVLQGAAQAELAIQLEGLPDRLVLPIAAGVNKVLTATVSGGKAEAAWLGASSAKSSGARVALAKAGEGRYEINLATSDVLDFLKSLGIEGEFRVYARSASDQTAASIAVRYELQLVPRRLNFPDSEAKVIVKQRSGKAVPGSSGSLTIHLGDITAGQVLVSIWGPTDQSVLDTASMREKEVRILKLADEEYALRLDRLVNLLVGEDYAEFLIIRSSAWERDRIDRLLQAVVDSQLTFIRNDQELTSKEFAAWLRLKHQQYGAKRATVADFIENTASRSSTTGKAYRVRLPSGETVNTAEWLRAEAERLRSKPGDEKQPAEEHPE